jgi:histone acetyltransferase (RNA polymerase elongator complex component)
MMKASIGIIPVFVSHMGCPNDCTFCNQRKINGVDDAILPEALPAFVATYLESMKRDQIELAFFGGSFTGIELSRQNAYLQQAAALKERGLIHKIRLSTRPDYIDHDTIERLKTYSVDLVELGCQSFDEIVLASAKRGHDVKAIHNAVSLLKTAGLSFGIQLMLGLPNDDFEKFKNSVKVTAALKPECVRLYPALVIRDTELEIAYQEGRFTPMSLDKAVSWTAYALKVFNAYDIKVIRMGLQRTDLIDFDSAVLAGPFHPAFGELVLSQLFYEAMAHIFEMDRGYRSTKNLAMNQLDNEHNPGRASVQVIVMVHPKQLSAAIGNKKTNFTKLLTKYGGAYSGAHHFGGLKMIFKGEDHIQMDTVTLTIDEQSYTKHIMK